MNKKDFLWFSGILIVCYTIISIIILISNETFQKELLFTFGGYTLIIYFFVGVFIFGNTLKND